MDLHAVSHRSLFTDCYGLNDREIVINIRTGKDITGVNLLFDDPYAHGIGATAQWVGKPMAMELSRELKHNYVWSATVKPEYRRLQYCFELFSGEESLLMLEDDFYTPEQAGKAGRIQQFFKFPYIIPAMW